MPYANEHAARQLDPSLFREFRRKLWGQGISAIYGIDESCGRAVHVQALRFNARIWTATEARKWLIANGYKSKVEPAKNTRRFTKIRRLNARIREIRKRNRK